MPKKTVIVTEHIHQAGLDLLASEFDVVRLPDTKPETLIGAAPVASAFLVRLAKITPEVLSAAPRLEVVAKHGVGTDNIDIAACTARGIPVTSTPVATEGAVAEHAISMILSLARKLAQTERGLREGRFFQTRDSAWMVDLAGKTLGVVGVGRIGARLVEICRLGFRMKVIAFDPFVPAERVAAIGAEPKDSLESLLAESDFVSIHVPLSPQTRGLVSARQLAMMKKSAHIVNCARGGIIDENDLAAALAEGTIAGAGLDVFVKEPLDPASPLLTAPNLIMTPHVAGGSQDALELTAVTAAEEIMSVLKGEQPRYLVNRKDLAASGRA